MFADADAQVVGVSQDSIESHHGFAGRPLVAVPAAVRCGRRGASGLRGSKRTLGVLPARVTFVIDGQPASCGTFSSLAGVNAHVDGALAVVRSLADRTA